MIRKSQRELERMVDDLGHGGSGGEWDDVQIVFVDPETGKHRTPDGDLMDPDAVDPIMTIGGEPPEGDPGAVGDPPAGRADRRGPRQEHRGRRAEGPGRLDARAVVEDIHKYSRERGLAAADPWVSASTSTVWRWVREAREQLHEETDEWRWEHVSSHDLRRSWATYHLVER